MPSVFVKNPEGWNELVRGPRGAVGRTLTLRGWRLAQMAKAQVGVDSTRLRNSIGYSLKPYRSSLMVEVGSSVKYALVHHEGSRPHIIRARRVKYLRFVRYGRIDYRTRVYHPGTKPNRYLTDNLHKVI